MIFSNGLGEMLNGADHLLFHSANRDAELRRDLPMFITLQAMQHEDRARALGQ
jgi:hypothetical protein